MSGPETRSALAEARRNELLSILATEGVVRISDLAERLNVTPITLRRDVTAMAAEGLLRRVHGGAAAIEKEPDGGDGTPATATATPIGILVPSMDYYWPGVIRGAEESAARLGIRLVLRGSSYEADDMRPQLERLLERNRVEGIVVAPNMAAAHTLEALEWLAATGTPAVLVERTAAVGPLHTSLESVNSDHPQGAELALRHLVGLGHRRVGLATSAASPTSNPVRRGWHEARVQVNLTGQDTVDHELPEPASPEWDHAADHLLDECESRGITALLIHADAAATALVQRWESRGHSVPGDLSVVAYDDEFAGLFTPRLTAVRPPRLSLGRTAIELLSARLADPQRPAHRVIITPSLRIRESTAPPA
jgi:DNA-binding LacI/PurR family transcriptional regulator